MHRIAKPNAGQKYSVASATTPKSKACVARLPMATTIVPSVTRWPAWPEHAQQPKSRGTPPRKPAYCFPSSLLATALTPAAATSTVVPTTVAPTFTVVATTVIAASATATTAQPETDRGSKAATRATRIGWRNQFHAGYTKAEKQKAPVQSPRPIRSLAKI